MGELDSTGRQYGTAKHDLLFDPHNADDMLRRIVALETLVAALGARLIPADKYVGNIVPKAIEHIQDSGVLPEIDDRG